LVEVMALRSHLLVACNIVGYGVSERRAADPLAASIPPRSLTVVDRGFFAAAFLLDIEAGEGRQWLTRARTTLAARVVQRYARGDELIELDVSPQARKLRPDLPCTWQMRAIKYKLEGFPEQTILTSLRDPKRYPAAEIVALYHERWELELGYDE